jgi:hypothetical protein
MVVDLPAPLVPKKPKISPWGDVEVDLRTASTSPNRLTSPWTETAGVTTTRLRLR